MEKDIQKKIIAYLKAEGAYVVKVSLANHSGVPDILCCFRERFIAIEVKTEEGRVTELQKFNIMQIQKSGGLAIVARSLEDVRAIIELMKKCKNLEINGIIGDKK